MHGDCTPQCMAMKLLVFGVILILVRLYTQWDIWVVLGTLLVIKAILLLIMPKCCCQKEPKKK